MNNLKFKGYCAEHGIKNNDLAQLLGIGRGSVNRKINGRQDWTISQIKTLCEHFKISADIFFA